MRRALSGDRLCEFDVGSGGSLMDTGRVEAELREKLSEAIRQLEDVQARLRGAHSASFGEQAIERESDEVDEKLEAGAIREIDAIKAALERIEAGKYGICTSCGDEIAAARLQALPYTTLCIACASK
ncbi:MAG: dimethylmenaquinone methyltransferase [Sneathiella sp.]|jgi:RNA polymerase-binding transcription factor DksA|nr:dimethylmenaquinone methyltransferase [Sneathiella sp.]|tara:strand:- start:53 stop:433 length:381 start_codon:yes stop_codon:yes gene_type:complete